ncbi:VOC family protein [Maritimibacter sp. UBA3975]|uniref:VOC family protein n=1 Tax=Maritimibacter sp. UBA3975 TaxID=1946833 RepID=UPI000C09F3EA|nr:VOC family protein [Maritimibacter sp. UBA3975]MAM62653.1 polyphosphate kinase [Maritimibacter sp.]|tara:strand:- start:4269 stop:4886 length:618 start_codon:yes stop_codon:yes gene_type:complete
MISANLDHLVVTAATLASGVELVETTLGQPMDGGGDHVAMGTHNRLMSMGPEDYLEVIAVNPDATSPGRPRFFDLDSRTGAAALTNWVLRVDDLAGALDLAPPGTGEGVALSRGPYAWRMAVPADGKLPFDGLFPSLIQWDSPHPAPAIPDGGARLVSLTLSHPEADALAAALEPLFSDARVTVEEGPVSLTARIRSAGAEVTLT